MLGQVSSPCCAVREFSAKPPELVHLVLVQGLITVGDGHLVIVSDDRVEDIDLGSKGPPKEMAHRDTVGGHRR